MEDVSLDVIKQQVFDKAPEVKVEASPAPAATAPAQQTVAGPTEEKPVSNPIPPQENQSTPSPSAFDPSTFLKETFGVDNADAIKQQISRVKELEEKAKTPAEYAYANEQAKLLATAINSGDFKPVKEYIDTQLMLSSLEGMTEDQQLKLYIKMQNPLFNDKLVEEEFNDMYVLNEEEVDESRVERERIKIAQKKMNDVAAAKAFFDAKKSKITLPEIKAQAEVVDPEYAAWKEQQSKIDADRGENVEAYSKLTPQDIASTFKFNDEANKLAFDISYEPDADSLRETLSTVTDDKKFLADYAGQDGSLDRKKFLQHIYAGRNLEKIANSLIVQAVNQTKKWFLMNQKNVNDPVVRNYNEAPQSEVQALRDKVFG